MNLPSRLVAAVHRCLAELLDDLITAECRHLLHELREHCPQLCPEPLGPGEVASAVTVPAASAAAVFAIAFEHAVGGDAAGPDPVVWSSGDDELLVHPGQVRLVLTDGFAIVGIPLYTEQTGDVQVSVPFAVGSPRAPLGMVIGTEAVPRGPAVIVQRWGSQLQAAAWQALVHLAAGIAAGAGADDQHQPLLPAAVNVTAEGLTVLPQARHAFDRTAS